MKAVKSILPYLKGKWNLVLLYMGSHFLSVLFTTLTLSMINPFLEIIFEKTKPVTSNPGFVLSKEGISNYFAYWMTDFIASHGNDKAWGLVFVCIILICTTFLKNLFLYLSKYILNPLRNGILRNIRKDMFAKIIELPIGFFTNERKGDILSRMTNDISAIEVSIIGTMELLFSTPLTIIFYFGVLLFISAKLFLFLLILLPVAGFIVGRVSKSLRKNTKRNQETQSSLLSLVEETLSGLRIIKAFHAEKHQKDSFNNYNDTLYNINNSIASRREMASPMSEFLGIVILSIIIWFGGKMALHNPPEIEPGMFIMFISLFYFLINPLKSLSQIFYNLHQGKAGIDRINLLLKAENEIRENANAKTLQDFKHSIEFKGVHFAYEGKKVLEDINLVIPKGATIALVGASGAGKSTLVDLIPRFHDAQQGEVLIDGISCKEYSIASLRKHMGIVSQEPILFNDTVNNNIALGDSNPNIERVMHAAAIANAHSFIAQKEKQYETTIGDRGNKLSGGEKQRLTIARAIYKNPPILILDEATSSLDTVSERQVQDAIEKLMENRTSVVIAHRLSTVQNADLIVVLEKGKIIEKGTHQELIQKQGAYKKLVDMQQVLQ